MGTAKYVIEGKTIPYTNTDANNAVKYGDVVSLTTRIGIAAADIAASGNGEVITEGVYELPAINTAAFAVGAAVYWSTTDKKLTATNTDVPAGWCVAAKAETAATARVKIG